MKHTRGVSKEGAFRMKIDSRDEAVKPVEG
jgi:hypothetical protein